VTDATSRGCVSAFSRSFGRSESLFRHSTMATHFPRHHTLCTPTDAWQWRRQVRVFFVDPPDPVQPNRRNNRPEPNQPTAGWTYGPMTKKVTEPNPLKTNISGPFSIQPDDAEPADQPNSCTTPWHILQGSGGQGPAMMNSFSSPLNRSVNIVIFSIISKISRYQFTILSKMHLSRG